MEELSRLAAEYATLAWHKQRVVGMGTESAVEITGVRIGDLILLSAPLEPLTEIGDILRERYGDFVWPIGYANGYQHYGAEAKRYKANAYEARECDLDPSWLDAYLDAADTVVAALK